MCVATRVNGSRCGQASFQYMRINSSELTACVAARSWLMARAMLITPIGKSARMAIMATARMPVADSTSISVTAGRRAVAVMLASPRPGLGRRSHSRLISQARTLAVHGEAVRIRCLVRWIKRQQVIDVVCSDLASARVDTDQEHVVRPVH